jgi:hypothetical protein
MWIVRLALNRPYTFIVVAILILLLSPAVILRTPTDIFPNIDIPVISVAWTYTGLNPEDLETRLTTPFEKGLTTLVDNIEHIESTTYSRTLNVEVDVDNPTGRLLPGAYAFVHLRIPPHPGSVTIPSNALLFRAEGLRVGVVRNGHVELTPIAIGQDYGSTVEVISGLSARDTVIVNPSDSLANEAAVQLVAKNANGGGQ